MERSYSSPDVPIHHIVPRQPIAEEKCETHHLFLVIGIILMIGSLIATGCLYSRLGYSAFAIGGGGVALAVILGLLDRYHPKLTWCEESVTRTTETIDTSPLLTANSADTTPLHRPTHRKGGLAALQKKTVGLSNSASEFAALTRRLAAEFS